MNPTDLSGLDKDKLHDWLVARRWFGSKAREVTDVELAEQVVLRDEAPALVLALVEARFGEGTHEMYQLPLGIRPVQDGWTEGVIDAVDGFVVYDALSDPAHARELLHRMRRNDTLATEEASLRFRWAESADAGGGGTVDVRPVGVEQSNSSVVFGETLILKAFRRVEPGVNPELELLRFLSDRGFPNIAALAGWYEYEGRLLDATLGILQEYLAGARDGWERVLDGLQREPDALLTELRELGAVVGDLHTILGSEGGDHAFAPEDPSMEALALLTADIDEQIERVFLDLPDSEEVSPILGRGQDVRELLQSLSHVGAGGRVIRTHGDLHLGQTMLTDRGWVILDFEGEPARPLPERRRKRPPLRDVAGMLRSFSYAAAGVEILRGSRAPAEWEHRAREAYLEGYLEHVDHGLLPPGQQAIDQLLSIFELEKAVYELRYEMNNRPEWVGIPVAGITRLLDTAFQ